MDITPQRTDETIDPDTEQVVLARLVTFEEDVKSAVPANEALAAIRKRIRHLAAR